MTIQVPINFYNRLIDKDGKATEYFQLLLTSLMTTIASDSEVDEAEFRGMMYERLQSDASPDASRISSSDPLAAGAVDDRSRLTSDPAQSFPDDRSVLAGDPPQAQTDYDRIRAEIPPLQQWSLTRVIQDTAANLTNYPAAAFNETIYVETDTQIVLRSNGIAWTQIIAPAFLAFLSAVSTNGALKLSGAGIAVRLGDDSNNSFLTVLDDAYAAGWSGNIQVPTKNAVYTEIQSLITRIPTALPVSVAQGGTGATSSSGALTNLGAAAAFTGINSTVPLAKLTVGGTNGSITFTNGVATAATNPT